MKTHPSADEMQRIIISKQFIKRNLAFNAADQVIRGNAIIVPRIATAKADFRGLRELGYLEGRKPQPLLAPPTK
jgi:hypothetical protein